MADGRNVSGSLGSVQLAVDAAVDRWFEEGSRSTTRGVDGVPCFVLVTGTPASGKTRLRHRKYGHGYVTVDAGDIFRSIPNCDELDFPGASEWLIDLIGARVAQRALEERRHVVTEVFGRDPQMTMDLIERMKALGYRTELVGVRARLEQSIEWNQARSPSNVSSYHTDEFNVRWLLEAAQLQQAKLQGVAPRPEVAEGLDAGDARIVD